MKLTELQDEWKKDSDSFDRSELGVESIRTPKLHHKYFKYFSDERLRLKQIQHEFSSLSLHKQLFYLGSLSEEVLKEKNWKPFALKILRTDLPLFLGADKDVQELEQKISYQEEKVALLESIIKMLTTRNFLIKNIIDWERFKVGA